MQWYQSDLLQYLWLLPILGWSLTFAWKRRMGLLLRFGHPDTLGELIRSRSTKKILWKSALLMMGFVFLIIALAQPQWGEEKKQLKRKGIELIFMVDTSLSMLAQDVKPNRMEKAKFLMKSFLSRVEGDRVGIVTFAGTGFLQSPLTLDYSAFSLFANSLGVGYVPDPGTSLSNGISMAVRSFPDTEKKYRALIVLSDGETSDEQLGGAIELAKKEKVRVYTIGIGTAEGEPIPLRSTEGKTGGYKKDRQGRIVITKLNKSLLEQIARETGGLYFPASPSEREVEYIYQHLQSLGKKELKERTIIEREDHFQFFLLLGLIVLILETLIGDRKRHDVRTLPTT